MLRLAGASAAGLSTAVVVAPAAGAAAGKFSIVRGGVAQAVVVIPEDASEQVEITADTLVEYVEKASGARLEIRRSGEPAQGDPIYLGHVGPLSPPVDEGELADLGLDGFLITATTESLTILGGSDWGTRHGVLEILERDVGVRWLLPGDNGEDVPEAATLGVRAGVLSRKPELATRVMSPLRTNAGDPFSPDYASQDPGVLWASRQRMRTTIDLLHNLWTLFPVEEFGTTHPEFYPVVDGEPRVPAPGVHVGWQPNFLVPGTVDVAAQKIVQFFDAHPEAITFSLSTNDSGGFSEDNLQPDPVTGEPSASEAYYRWVNDVIDAVNQARPHLTDRLYGVVAYREVVRPPSFPVHPQAVPAPTSDRFGWNNPEFRAEDRALTEAWAAVTSNVGTYEYAYGGPYLAPRMYLDTMADTLRFASANNVEHVYSEIYPNWGEGPKPYIWAKLLWDPSVDVRRELRDWCRRAVGPRGCLKLARYFELWEEIWTTRVPESSWFRCAWKARNPYLYFHYPDYLDSFSAEDADQAGALLRAAVATAATPEQQARADQLSRTFDFYEAAVKAWAPRRNPPRTQAEADALITEMTAELPARVEHAVRREEALADLTADPILRLTISPSRYGLRYSGYSGYELFGLVDYVRDHEPDGGPILQRLTDLVADPPSEPVARSSSLTVDIALGEVANRTVNGSFEDGEAGWTMSGGMHPSDREARTGQFSAGIVGPDDGGIRQAVPVAAGLLAIRCSYLASQDAEDAFMTFVLALNDAEGTRLGVLEQRLLPCHQAVGEWNTFELLSDIPATFGSGGQVVAQAEIVLTVVNLTEPGAEVHVDDVEVFAMPAPGEGDNLLPNPGFEEVAGDLPAHWTRVVGAVSSSTEVVRSGARSVFLDDPSPTSAVGLRSAHVSVEPGRDYRATVEVHNVFGNSAHLYLEFWDSDGTRVAVETSGSSETGSWLGLSCDVVAPPTAVTSTVLLYRDSAGTGASYFDDASLIQQPQE